MTKKYNILVVEDEITNSVLLRRILTREGFDVVTVSNGLEAKVELKNKKFDAVLTDWMMPLMDGIELIKFIREQIKPLPYVIMITALVSDIAKNYALESGADDFIAKPIDVDSIALTVRDGIAKLNQSESTFSLDVDNGEIFHTNPPFPAVAMVASTGGPITLIEIFRKIEYNANAAFFIVQHGPNWMLETLANKIAKESNLAIVIPKDITPIQKRTIYLAPSDTHMLIDGNTFSIVLDSRPKINFVRPSADLLFSSIAKVFGRYSVGVVLSGLGKDGSQGIVQISNANGSIIIQDPETAIAPTMPQSAIDTGVYHNKLNVRDIGQAIIDAVFPLAASIKINSNSDH